MRVALAIPLAIAVAIAGCGLFLDDLSSGGDSAGDDDGGALRDVEAADATTTNEAGGQRDADADADADAGDADADATTFTPRLDCDGAVICEGFENITTFTNGIAAGIWDQVDEQLGNASIDMSGAPLGQRAARFVSPANTTGLKQSLLIGDNGAPLATGRSIIDVDFDLWLDYDPAQFDGTERRNLVGIFLPSTSTDMEFAGLSVMANKGLHAEIREYAAASSTTKKPGEDPFVTLAGQPQLRGWHHYRLELTFATGASGGLKAYVDGVLVGQLGNLLTRTNGSAGATTFIFWVGASAGVGAPPLTAVYDDVEVRTR